MVGAAAVAGLALELARAADAGADVAPVVAAAAATTAVAALALGGLVHHTVRRAVARSASTVVSVASAASCSEGAASSVASTARAASWASCLGVRWVGGGWASVRGRFHVSCFHLHMGRVRTPATSPRAIHSPPSVREGKIMLTGNGDCVPGQILK